MSDEARVTGESARGWRFEAIGTQWTIDTGKPLTETERAAVLRLIDDFDREWSRFRGDSTVRALASGGSRPLPTDAEAMFAVYADLGAATDGAVNPLVGVSLEALGYDTSYSLRPGDPISAPRDWRRVLSTGAGALTVSQPALIDVGAIGKGRLVDLVLEYLEDAWPGSLTVDAGGDIRCSGVRERIGLEHPYDPTRIIGVVDLADAALCASATNRRAWGDGLHHVLDARTGMPVRAVAATWAVAPMAMMADAAATALFFDGGAQLARRWGVEWVRMTTAGRVEWSPGFGTERCRAELFT
ncbi:FAD:protein FMN transferase [Microbacterium sp.]|jgi:thiamine biosynthesis lipoprotein|uniref:FAD:protein FMN transferase n=1 Tax=Microbacterium sp. TaxID=51671 RepID=UPI002625E422|nr:FAD:protein FMN transferase [Microbacterium sp.]